MGIQWNEPKIIKRTSLEFKGDITYCKSNTNVAAGGSLQKSNEALVAKM